MCHRAFFLSLYHDDLGYIVFELGFASCTHPGSGVEPGKNKFHAIHNPQ